jgi:hypothetical protein
MPSLLGDEVAGEPAGVLDEDDPDAVALDAVEQRAEPRPRLDRVDAGGQVRELLDFLAEFPSFEGFTSRPAMASYS